MRHRRREMLLGRRQPLADYERSVTRKALVQEVMQERGYPTNDFERRVADISVDHPDLVEKYRNAHGIAQASERGEASTEDMRHSVRHYRALFAELLGGGVDSEVENVDDISSRDDGRVESQNVERLR